MDIFEALFTRRSIRKYTSQPISDEDLRLILKAAMLAPSAVNEQPWHFVVARDEETRSALSQTASPYTSMAAKAQVVIVICGDTADDKGEGYWPQDCAAAVENLMLAARGKGIGSVWCGVYPKQDRIAHVRKTVGIPEGVIPFALVSLGYPVKEFKEEDRFRAERVHNEKW